MPQENVRSQFYTTATPRNAQSFLRRWLLLRLTSDQSGLDARVFGEPVQRSGWSNHTKGSAELERMLGEVPARHQLLGARRKKAVQR